MGRKLPQRTKTNCQDAADAVLCASYAWDRESSVNRDFTNDTSLVRTSEGSNIAAGEAANGETQPELTRMIATFDWNRLSSSISRSGSYSRSLQLMIAQSGRHCLRNKSIVTCVVCSVSTSSQDSNSAAALFANALEPTKRMCLCLFIRATSIICWARLACRVLPVITDRPFAVSPGPADLECRM